MNRKYKKGIAISFAVAALLAIAIIADLLVSSKQGADENTVAMARIDFKEDIQQRDAEKITNWLYAQKGVDHVLCNPDGNCVVFTYYPAQINAGKLDIKMREELAYAGHRYVPTESELAKGCPVSPNSITYKVYTFFKNII